MLVPASPGDPRLKAPRESIPPYPAGVAGRLGALDGRPAERRELLPEPARREPRQRGDAHRTREAAPARAVVGSERQIPEAEDRAVVGVPLARVARVVPAMQPGRAEHEVEPAGAHGDVGMLELAVEDHGRGMDGERRRGLGLVAMRERAELLGGTLEFTRPAEGGTLVRLRVPVPSRPAGA